MKIKRIKSPEMGGKRTATTDLNHDNWDKEEEPEEKGIFKIASENELQTRVIKKARRKLTGENASEALNKSVFSGFTAFAKTPSTATTVSSTGSPFSFLSKISTATSAGIASEEVKEKQKDQTSNDVLFNKSNTYYAKLKGLNQAVSNWIKTHVDINPLCILSPIFNDYEKYLKEIEQDDAKEESKANQCNLVAPTNANGKAIGSDKGKSDGFIFSTSNKSSTSFSFTLDKKNNSNASELAKPSSSTSFCLDKKIDTQIPSSSEPTIPFGGQKSNSTFSFGLKTDATSTTIATSTFSFSQQPTTSAPANSTGFSFTGAKPFTFGNSVTAKPIEESDATKEDEDDEPPKVEFKPVVEEDSVYSKKCKVFVKQSGHYADRGVGTLYLKPVKDSEKTQLLVRADTNLGNILLNLILNEAIPTQKMGKNNVMMVCIPTPESEQKPTSILLRVKTGEEADKLLENINKYKK